MHRRGQPSGVLNCAERAAARKLTIGNLFLIMAKSRKSHASARLRNKQERPSRALIIAAATALLIAAALAVYKFRSGADQQPRYRPRPVGTITYNKDIAPVMYAHCLNCHRPGESAHLDL